ncbi:MAG TPA: STAS domain-containing protein [Actinomycetota bacterium]|nr:STAS domain-containing protein [Actinomycetota bacterium]
MTFRLRVVDSVLVVSGELDMADATKFSEQATSALDPTREVVLDISDLEFIDSAGLRAIVRLSEDVCPYGIVLRAPRDNVLRVLEMLSIERVAGIRVERRRN